jgi:hypothetical protein
MACHNCSVIRRDTGWVGHSLFIFVDEKRIEGVSILDMVLTCNALLIISIVYLSVSNPQPPQHMHSYPHPPNSIVYKTDTVNHSLYLHHASHSSSTYRHPIPSHPSYTPTAPPPNPTQIPTVHISISLHPKIEKKDAHNKKPSAK